MRTRLTIRRLRAMEAALAAMMGGMQGEGDWPEEVRAEDGDAALDWIGEEIRTRLAKQDANLARACARRAASKFARRAS